MTSEPCIFVGGPWDGQELHVPKTLCRADHNPYVGGWVSLRPKPVSSFMCYIRTDQVDLQARPIFQWTARPNAR